MPDPKPNPPVPIHGCTAFLLAGFFGAFAGIASCFMSVTAGGALQSDWPLLAAWAAVTLLWVAWFAKWQTRASFLIGSILGFVSARAWLYAVAKLMSPFPDNWSGPG